MKKAALAFVFMLAFALPTVAQAIADSSFKLALPDHPGQLRWSAEGFKIIQSSAKPMGREIGIRGKDEAGHLFFLGFLFQVTPPIFTTEKCRDNVLESEKKVDKTLKVLTTSDLGHPNGLPVSVVTYTTAGRNGNTAYMVRGFVATGDICGDLEIYSDSPIATEDAVIKQIFAGYQLDEHYVPKYKDVFFYADVLYQSGMYKAAAPVFEMALTKLREDPATGLKIDTKTMMRVTVDQAGMSYGMSGDISKARALFEKAVAEDPDYPMYYYNLACADAEEKNLSGARNHLQQAFARKANVIPGETMPDPTKDDSFLPYRHDKKFWEFLEALHSQ